MTKYNLDAMPKSLFTVGNPKTAKGESMGYLTAILHLAPYKLSGRNVCSHASAGCAAACLNTAGRGGINLDSDGLNIIQVARIQRTRYFTRDRAAFMLDVADELSKLAEKAIRDGLTLVVRMNGTSDLPWENVPVGAFPNIMAMFPATQFYDYTKVPGRAIRFGRGKLPANYHLTFSLSESNDNSAFDAMKYGVNVAVAFNRKRGDNLPTTYRLASGGGTSSYEVVDGDKSDLRFLDKQGPVFVGLRAKGRGKADTTGFIRNV